VAPIPPASAEGDINGLHILLAEDHHDLHLAMKMSLERAGATVESAYDGNQAVALGASARFDVVLMDLRMPLLDGFEAAHRLRSQGCRVPIIGLTADTDTVYRDAALEAGFDACLSKPFTLADLTASIRHSWRQP
jgi:DNA-binding response OmpR family regulator